MFCRACEICLDWQDAVSLDLTGKKTCKIYFTRVFCGKCFDKLNVQAAVKTAREKTGEEIVVTTTDGRQFLDDHELTSAKVAETAETFSQRAANWTRHDVQGYRVEIERIDWGRFFLYQNATTSNWHVCEEETGAAFSTSSNRQAALREAEQSLRKAGKKKFLAARTRLLKQQKEHLPEQQQAEAVPA
jgi:hypothetical protein